MKRYLRNLFFSIVIVGFAFLLCELFMKICDWLYNIAAGSYSLFMFLTGVITAVFVSIAITIKPKEKK